MKTTLYLLLGLSFCALCSCSTFLDEKPDAKLNTPSTNKDLVAILDNHSFLNPALLEIAADDFYLSEANYNGVTNVEFREAYSWSTEPTHNSFWNNSYQTIFYCNTVLDYIDRVRYESDGLDAQEIRGIACFQRAFAYYSLVQVFCRYYQHTNGDALGLVLKLNSDINEKLQRASLADTYAQIITDLNTAVALLPESRYTYPVRPNKAAAYAMLSRIYLGLGRYVEAQQYAISALSFEIETLDFKNVTHDKPYPFPPYNQEVLFFATIVPTSVLVESRAFVDTALYKSYSDTDLRKLLYFTKNATGNMMFTGNYNAFDQGLFCGPTVAEMILNKAEVECRNGKSIDAKNTLAALLERRYTAVPSVPSEKDMLLNFILEERRKELFFRGVRWTDLRRLSVEGREVKLVRKVGGKRLEKSGNDLLDFAYKIPLQALERGSLQQNQ